MLLARLTRCTARAAHAATPAPALLAGALIMLYVTVLARLLPVAADDFGLAAVFSADEALSGRIVRRMLDGPTLNPGGFFAYGALYHELTALVLLPFMPFGVGERGVLIGLRAVSLAATATTLVLTYLLGRRLYGGPAGLLATLFLVCSTELAGWSLTAHPDTLQLALINAALLAICAARARPERRLAGAAALLAGLAFATKYAGLLLLPVLGLAVLCALVERGLRGAVLLNRLLADLILVSVLFLSTFLLTNPYALVEWRRFVTQLREELTRAREGHVTLVTASRWHWLGLVSARSFAGPLLLPAAAGWLAAIVGRRGDVARRAEPWWHTTAHAIDARVLLGIWSFGYLAYLVAAVGYQAPRHALPALPGLTVLAAGAVATLFARRAAWGIALGAVLAAVVVVSAAGPAAGLYRERAERTDGIEADPRVAAGRRLAALAGAETSILSDAYVYLPSSLSGAVITFGMTEREVARLRPVLIAVNEEIGGRFRHPEGGSRYVDGVAAYAERAEAYARLEAGRLGCYTLIDDFGMVRLYADERALQQGAQHGCGLMEMPG